MNSTVIIPALNPARGVIDYVKGLLDQGFKQIIIVNDGSTDDCLPIFAELSQLKGCIVLTHGTNRGKGQALKTAFHYFLKHIENQSGVVTADADGQHTIADVCRVASSLKAHPDKLILGVRNFNHPDIPPKSVLGNKVTSHVFYRLFKKKITDTQTGLRGIPKAELNWMLKIKGERYEFEMNMLINAIKRNLPILQTPIETVYFNKNEGSYYKAVKDSIRILSRIVSGYLRKTNSYQDMKWSSQHEK